jgi:hypothetical protein
MLLQYGGAVVVGHFCLGDFTRGFIRVTTHKSCFIFPRFLVCVSFIIREFVKEE